MTAREWGVLETMVRATGQEIDGPARAALARLADRLTTQRAFVIAEEARRRRFYEVLLPGLIITVGFGVAIGVLWWL